MFPHVCSATTLCSCLSHTDTHTHTRIWPSVKCSRTCPRHRQDSSDKWGPRALRGWHRKTRDVSVWWRSALGAWHDQITSGRQEEGILVRKGSLSLSLGLICGLLRFIKPLYNQRWSFVKRHIFCPRLLDVLFLMYKGSKFISPIAFVE